MFMTPEQAAAEGARVIAEHDALCGTPEQHRARELHEQAQAERAKQQKERDQRVAAQQVTLQTQQAMQQQKSDAYWQGHATFIYGCIKSYFEKNFEAFFDKHYAASSEGAAEHLNEVFGQIVAQLRQEWTALVAKRIAELASKADEKLNERIAALERELATVKGELCSARDMTKQLRTLEQGLAARQDAKDAAKKGAKGDKGERGERGAHGERGERGAPGKSIMPPEIAVWELDLPNYRAAPLLTDGRRGAELNLAPFLQQFVRDALQRSISNLISYEVDQLQEALKRSAPFNNHSHW